MDEHTHDHGHGHVHAPTNFGRAFAIGVILNVILVVLQFAYGIIANSMALIADAGHNLTDVLGLLMAWGANAMSRWPPTARYTYGFRSSSILAALANAIVLLIAVGAIAWEAVQRFVNPQPVSEIIVMVVAASELLSTAAPRCSSRRGGRVISTSGARSCIWRRTRVFRSAFFSAVS